MLKEYACSNCNEIYMRHPKQVNAVIKRSGKWRCMRCSAAINSKLISKPVGYIRKHKQSGYLDIKVDSGFIRYHRFVMESHLGRKLEINEDVHHIDENIYNNELSNLMLVSHGEHTRLHNLGGKLKQSTKDKISKANQKLMHHQVVEIKKLLKDGVIQRLISINFNVSPMVISRIARNLTYKGIV